MPKLPVPSVPHEVLRILEREAKERNVSLTRLIKDIVVEWAIEQECNKRCEVSIDAEKVGIWMECKQVCIETMRRVLLGG